MKLFQKDSTYSEILFLLRQLFILFIHPFIAFAFYVRDRIFPASRNGSQETLNYRRL